MEHSSQAHSSKAPISKCKFSKLISIHFLEELVNRICSYIKVFSHQVIILLILTTFSLDYILIFREKIDLGLCHEVLGQFCAEGITFFLYPTQNAP